MKRPLQPAAMFAASATIAMVAACAGQSPAPVASAGRDLEVVDYGARERPPFRFSAADGEFLDAVQRGAFRYLWEVVDPATGMVYDRTSVRVISVAGVGFQLSAIPVGVERGWITREQGRERASLILESLAREPSNRHAGMFFHYLKDGSASPVTERYETVASTIDSAILFAGMMTVSTYFGGDIGAAADRLVAGADWNAFVATSPPEAWAKGFITLGWRAEDPSRPGGDGKLLPFYWADAGDEQKLVTFLAVGSVEPSIRVGPDTYFRLRRQLGEYGDSGPFVWFPWSGALFTHFFAHCWIDYASVGPDDPARFGVANRPRVDWWENSRRAVLMHRRKAIENPERLATLGPNAWGLGAHDAASGYVVNHLFPRPIAWPGAREGVDYPEFEAKDEWGDGTLAPYNAGCSIMFDPRAALDALRHYAGLPPAPSKGPVWKSPADGGFGFQDAVNAGTGWVAPDCVAIDEGPLILAIENARSGLIWDLFAKHPVASEAMTRLNLVRNRR